MKPQPSPALAVLAAIALLVPAAAGEPAAPPAPPDRPDWQVRIEGASASPDAWRARCAGIRLQILAAAGLYPPFERPPLRPVVFGKIERDGYSVEKVHVETWPGFHLTGNLYRPLGRKGPFPGVVSPHGHWKHGRFNDDKDGSVPGRAITLARLGFVVFSYDMVGYGDLNQLKHEFGDTPWGLSLCGLQLWDSLRAVDLLCSLPDVDPKRIGATGASGGGTQTFLLAAADDRIACAAPVNMVAAEFQGGCSCENAPLLRIDLNNVEIAAAAAPRPLLLVCATGDWTKDTPTRAAPMIQAAYGKLGAPDRFACVQFKAGHNYNRDSREAVYAWLVRHLQGEPGKEGRPAAVRDEAGRERIPEPPFAVETREDLAVFGAGHPRPEGAVDREGLAKVLKDAIRAQLEALRPRDAAGLARFRELMTPALRAMLLTDPAQISPLSAGDGPLLVKLAPADGSSPAEPTAAAPPGADILTLGRIDPVTVSHGTADQRKGYPLTYYRTHLAVRTKITLAGILGFAIDAPAEGLRLAGLDDAGPVVLLARALVPPDVKVAKTIVDVQGIVDDDPASWAGERAHPGILRIGGLRTAGILAASLGGELVIHNTQGKFDAAWIREAFKAAGRERALTVSEEKWPAEKIRDALK